MLLSQRSLTIYKIVLGLFSLLFLYPTPLPHQTCPSLTIPNHLHSFYQPSSIYSSVSSSSSSLPSLLSLLSFHIVVVMNCLRQAFLHQETAAVINGWLWELVVTPLGRCKDIMNCLPQVFNQPPRLSHYLFSFYIFFSFILQKCHVSTKDDSIVMQWSRICTNVSRQNSLQISREESSENSYRVLFVNANLEGSWLYSSLVS